MGATLETLLGILNGTIGDYLARTRNGLATEMHLRHGGAALEVDRAALGRALPGATPRVVLLVHGVMGTERDWAMPDGSDYGSLLARDLGFTPLRLRYNSGRAIHENGACLAALLERLRAAYPVPLVEILPVGYSMGGLVVRSALDAAGRAGHGWLALVRRAAHVGTPHRGAHYERLGRVVAGALAAFPDPTVRLVGAIAGLRSEGVKDLGDAALRPGDRIAPLGARPRRPPVPLPPSIRHCLIAGTLSSEPAIAALLGDGVVPLASATDGACGGDSRARPPAGVHVLAGVGHVALARHPEVYARLRAWCLEESAVEAAA